jgi:hypothetical protein
LSAVRALAPQVPLRLPVKLLPILQPRRFKIMHGGRGGAKSHTVAQVLLMMGLQNRLRVLCVRQIQKSVAKSSMQVLKDYIDRLGLGAYYQVLQTEIRGYNGTTFEFSGLQDHTADSIKSFEGANITWVEEAHSVSAKAWNILIPTILRTQGAEIWATFNPDDEADYVYHRFVKNTDPDAWVCAINWRDNPWFNDAMDEERLKLKAINDDLYGHVWEGNPRSAAGLLFKRRWFQRFNLSDAPKILNKYVGSDYASGPDPDNPDSDPDWNEHGCAGLDAVGNLWFVDWYSSQDDPHECIQGWLALIRRQKPRPLIAFEEKGGIRNSVNGAINKAMRESTTFIQREGLPSMEEKAVRAFGFAARAAAGTVWIPNTEWGDRLIEQLCAFNGQQGRTDDMVDVCSLLARGLDLMADAYQPKDTRPVPPEPFTDAWFAARDKGDQAEQQRREGYMR